MPKEKHCDLVTFGRTISKQTGAASAPMRPAPKKRCKLKSDWTRMNESTQRKTLGVKNILNGFAVLMALVSKVSDSW